MLILVTNDDGITAAGIKALVESLKKIGDVAVVAPERERSAVGHAITMHKPLRANREKFFGEGIDAWSVNGTPSDCVKLGIEVLAKEKPDLVFSGINRGPNLGTDVLYSGTVSAAVEAVMMGVPSAALSLASYEYEDYGAASEFAVSLALNMYREGLEGDTLLNVNVPGVSRDEIKGVRVTRLGPGDTGILPGQAGPTRTGILPMSGRENEDNESDFRHKPCGRNYMLHYTGSF